MRITIKKVSIKLLWSGAFIFISNNLTTCLPWRIAQSRNPEIRAKRLKPLQQKSVREDFQNQINSEIRKGSIKSISAEQFLINIPSLRIFPFIAKPMLKKVLQKTEKDYKEMIQVKKKELAMFIINAIKN